MLVAAIFGVSHPVCTQGSLRYPPHTHTGCRVHENRVVAELLRGHLALQPGEAARHHALREYNAAGVEALTVLLRKERTPVGGCMPRGWGWGFGG